MQTLNLGKSHANVIELLLANNDFIASGDSVMIGAALVKLEYPSNIAYSTLDMYLNSDIYRGDIMLSSASVDWLDELSTAVANAAHEGTVMEQIKSAYRAAGEELIMFIGEHATGIKTGIEASSAIYCSATWVARRKQPRTTKRWFMDNFLVPVLSATACVMIDRCKDYRDGKILCDAFEAEIKAGEAKK